MKKRFGYLTIAFAVFALTACSSSDSPTEAKQPQIQAENESSSSTADLPAGSTVLSSAGSITSAGSSETTVPESSESGAPKSSESTTPKSSVTSAPESAGTTTTSSTSTLTPLQEYEQARAFIDDGWRDECLKLANEYRASEGVAPLVLADDDVQYCTIQQAAADMEENKAHGHSRMCGIGAQNSGPNFSTSWKKNATETAKGFIKMMWEDEKALVTSGERDPNKDEDYQYIGHYLNMRNPDYKKLSCGIALSDDGKKGWFNMNFYR